MHNCSQSNSSALSPHASYVLHRVLSEAAQVTQTAVVSADLLGAGSTTLVQLPSSVAGPTQALNSAVPHTATHLVHSSCPEQPVQEGIVLRPTENIPQKTHVVSEVPVASRAVLVKSKSLGPCAAGHKPASRSFRLCRVRAKTHQGHAACTACPGQMHMKAYSAP